MKWVDLALAKRKKRPKKNHTCSHLLTLALRQLLKSPSALTLLLSKILPYCDYLPTYLPTYLRVFDPFIVADFRFLFQDIHDDLGIIINPFAPIPVVVNHEHRNNKRGSSNDRPKVIRLRPNEKILEVGATINPVALVLPNNINIYLSHPSSRFVSFLFRHPDFSLPSIHRPIYSA